MSPSFLPVLDEIDPTRLKEPQPGPEELRRKIDDAVLHCLQLKAKAIEAAEVYAKTNSIEAH